MRKIVYINFVIGLMALQSCGNKKSATKEVQLPKPMVSITHPVLSDIGETTEVNGQVLYLNKTNITAPISGYVTSVNVKIGDRVKKGMQLFSIQTKESIALKKSGLNTSNDFGIIPVYASSSGFVNSLSISDPGVFIIAGTSMAAIIKSKNMVIQVNAPYRYSKILSNKNHIEVVLPDKEILAAQFYKKIPVVNPVSQTEQIYFVLIKYHLLPENLNVIVRIPTAKRQNVITLPKNVVLTNETQNKFWIMKIVHDSVAVEVPVTKGLENSTQVEIIKPQLKLTDKIIQKGAYGLPDSTLVEIK